ncbi:hypothetical protein ACH429_02505 [Streptomyces pathocidini]|uniref:Uncharacterized protein n=1 Tax=Streptomyces pathocidini TaxID=1650571 RepID=A0ABW7UK27_9ACTN|nr:hypothetical protein [Streptomyces pathocidini]
MPASAPWSSGLSTIRLDRVSCHVPRPPSHERIDGTVTGAGLAASAAGALSAVASRAAVAVNAHGERDLRAR